MYRHIEHLNLSSRGITDVDQGFVGALPSLKEVSLSGNKLVSLPNALPPTVLRVDLVSNEFVSVPNTFVQLPKLEHINLGFNCIDASGLSTFAMHSATLWNSIQSLDLAYNKLCDLVMTAKALDVLGQLAHLVLMGNPIVLNARYRIGLIAYLPQIVLLDDVRVHSGERQVAADIGDPIKAMSTRIGTVPVALSLSRVLHIPSPPSSTTIPAKIPSYREEADLEKCINTANAKVARLTQEFYDGIREAEAAAARAEDEGRRGTSGPSGGSGGSGGGLSGASGNDLFGGRSGGGTQGGGGGTFGGVGNTLGATGGATERGGKRAGLAKTRGGKRVGGGSTSTGTGSGGGSGSGSGSGNTGSGGYGPNAGCPAGGVGSHALGGGDGRGGDDDLGSVETSQRDALAEMLHNAMRPTTVCGFDATTVRTFSSKDGDITKYKLSFSYRLDLVWKGKEPGQEQYCKGSSSQPWSEACPLMQNYLLNIPVSVEGRDFLCSGATVVLVQLCRVQVLPVPASSVPVLSLKLPQLPVVEKDPGSAPWTGQSPTPSPNVGPKRRGGHEGRLDLLRQGSNVSGVSMGGGPTGTGGAGGNGPNGQSLSSGMGVMGPTGGANPLSSANRSRGGHGYGSGHSPSRSSRLASRDVGKPATVDTSESRVVSGSTSASSPNAGKKMADTRSLDHKWVTSRLPDIQDFEIPVASARVVMRKLVEGQTSLEMPLVLVPDPLDLSAFKRTGCLVNPRLDVARAVMGDDIKLIILKMVYERYNKYSHVPITLRTRIKLHPGARYERRSRKPDEGGGS